MPPKPNPTVQKTGPKIGSVLHGGSSEYKVEKYLGKGSYGQVVQCTNLNSAEKIAVKIVKKQWTYVGQREVNILEEIRKHKKNNLVRFLDHFIYKGRFCLVFEMLDRSFDDLMQQRSHQPLRLSEIRVISQQLLVALNALKDIHIVHADIKPDNIMLINHNLQPFKLKLIDFGMAFRDADMKSGNTIQVIAYRAPEVILGLPLTEAIDMWALGCVLAFLYLGQHLYPTKCEYEALRLIVQMQGVPDRLLNCGIHTTHFFNKDQNSLCGPWRLKTRDEFKQLTTSGVLAPYTGISHAFTSLKDIANPYPETTAAIECEDTEAFLSLLRRMLDVDLERRITPNEALGHRFITMRHFPQDSEDNSYVQAANSVIDNCHLEQSSVEFNYKTSSEMGTFQSVDDEPIAGRPSTTNGLDETSKKLPGINAATLMTYANLIVTNYNDVIRRIRRQKEWFGHFIRILTCRKIDVREE